jgi:cell division protease FtsH
MSEKLGPLRYSENEEEVFLGHSVTQRKNISDATAHLIDEESRGLVEGGEKRAREILTEHIDDLHTLAKALLEHETLSADEIARLLKGEKIVRPDQDETPKDAGHRTSVPTSRGRKDPTPGMTPEPQPGA